MDKDITIILKIQKENIKIQMVFFFSIYFLSNKDYCK